MGSIILERREFWISKRDIYNIFKSMGKEYRWIWISLRKKYDLLIFDFKILTNYILHKWGQ